MMPVLNFTPFPELTTERLLLRQLVLEGDEEEIFFLRSDKRILKYLLITKAKTLEDAREFIHKINKSISENECIYWGIALKGEKNLIGTICLWNISKENFRAEIGFVLHPDYQRKGFMHEALAKVLEYGFKNMQLHSIEGNVAPANTASINLLEKNGFQREAYFKENVFFNGKFLDTAIYSLINPLP